VLNLTKQTLKIKAKYLSREVENELREKKERWGYQRQSE
jgi:hypothetical protein